MNHHDILLIEIGQKEERKAIVDWLRRQQYRQIADWIEKEAHREDRR